MFGRRSHAPGRGPACFYARRIAGGHHDHRHSVSLLCRPSNRPAKRLGGRNARTTASSSAWHCSTITRATGNFLPAPSGATGSGGALRLRPGANHQQRPNMFENWVILILPQLEQMNLRQEFNLTYPVSDTTHPNANGITIRKPWHQSGGHVVPVRHVQPHAVRRLDQPEQFSQQSGQLSLGPRQLWRQRRLGYTCTAGEGHRAAVVVERRTAA